MYKRILATVALLLLAVTVGCRTPNVVQGTSLREHPW